MNNFQKRQAVFFRLCGWNWRTVFLGLKQRHGFSDSLESIKKWGRSQEYVDLKNEALGEVLKWANEMDNE